MEQGADLAGCCQNRNLSLHFIAQLEKNTAGIKPGHNKAIQKPQDYKAGFHVTGTGVNTQNVFIIREKGSR